MSRRRKIVTGTTTCFILLVAPVVVWFGLNYKPAFYRQRAAMPPERRRAEADRFVAQSLQLRNDIANEERWEAVFTDEEVNAWLSEDLVMHFADQLPSGVHEPLVAFNLDRVTLAFKLDRGPFRTLVWVIARAHVPEDNTLALTLERIRAGAMPVPAEEIIGQITTHARLHGLDIQWEQRNGEHVATIHYTPDPGRLDVVLERVQVLDGQLYVSGRSSRVEGPIAVPTLPDRRVLRSTFPTRKHQPGPPAPSRSELRRTSSTSPANLVPDRRTKT